MIPVEVIGNDYDIEVFGAFFANGEEGNEVQIAVGELPHTAAENMSLRYSNVPKPRNTGYTKDFSIYPNKTSLNFGKYEEDFSTTMQGWTFKRCNELKPNGAFYVW